MLARPPGPLRAPRMPAARRGARCPVPAAAADRAAAGSDRGQPALTSGDGGARSLAPRLPAAPRRTPVRPGDAARPPAPSSPPPPARASHGHAARGGRLRTRGPPRAARAVGVAASWGSERRRSGLARRTRGRRRVKRAPAAGRPLNPLSAAEGLPLPAPPTPKDAGGACRSRGRGVRINRSAPCISSRPGMARLGFRSQTLFSEGVLPSAHLEEAPPPGSTGACGLSTLRCGGALWFP